MVAISVKNLNFCYHKNPAKKVLDNINLSIAENEFVTLMGSTGAGKSTLCFCMNNLIPQFFKGDYSGYIELFGENIKEKRPQELIEKVGIVFQDFEMQLFSSNIELEAAFLPQNLGLKREEQKLRVNDSLKLVNLLSYKDSIPAYLSGGNKQKLAIASIIAGLPKILILDEVTTDLDTKSKLEIYSLNDILKKKFTILLVDHETEYATKSARIFIMDSGKIIKCGKPEHVLTDNELLETHGIKPLAIFQFLKDKKLDFISFDTYEIFEYLKRNNFKIDTQNYEKLLEKDLERQKNYKEAIIEVNNFYFSYDGKKNVLEEINFKIRSGEFIAIIGENASGKTTLAKSIAGLLPLNSGEIKVEGISVSKQKIYQLAQKVGYVFQNPDNQIFAENVYEEVAFGPKNFKLPEDKIREYVKEALKAVNLQDKEQEDPFSLTKGERQCVAVASILAQRPKVLILDEPTTGLDYNQTKSMMKLLKKLNNSGYTVIIITHSIDIVCEYVDRCVVLKDGRILIDAATREVFKNETLLNKTNIILPQIIKLSNLFNKTLLNLAEFEYCVL